MSVGSTSGLGSSGGGGGGANLTPSSVRLDTISGLGTTSNNKINIFTNNAVSGSDLTYVQSAANGDSIIVNTPGYYNVQFRREFGNTGQVMAITKNCTAAQKLLSPDNVSFDKATQIIDTKAEAGATLWGTIGDHYVLLAQNDELFAHTGTNTVNTGANNAQSMFRITGPLNA